MYVFTTFDSGKKPTKNMFFLFFYLYIKKKKLFLETSLIGKTKTFVQRSTLGLLSMPIKTI